MTPSGRQKGGWLEVRIEAPPPAHEILSALLFDLGCTGILTEEFPKDRLRAYFPSTSLHEQIHGRLASAVRDAKRICALQAGIRVSYHAAADRDWDLLWRRFFRPDRITPRLTVVPAWEKVPSKADGHVLRIDPGPAFGTGLHATTRLCLEALEQGCASGSWSLLDVGTGSGILAMYGARLGAFPIKAVDIDPEAISWAAHNLELNGLSRRIELSSEPIARLRGGFSVVVANLILHDIQVLMEDLTRLTAPGGCLILSGLLREQVNRVADLLGERGLVPEGLSAREEWAAIIASSATREPVPATPGRSRDET